MYMQKVEAVTDFLFLGSKITANGDYSLEIRLSWQLSQLRICLQCRRPGFDPWVKKIPWRNGKPLQNPCQENPMDRGAWWAAVYGVTKSQALLSD